MVRFRYLGYQFLFTLIFLIRYKRINFNRSSTLISIIKLGEEMKKML